MGLFSKTKGRTKHSGTKADKPSAESARVLPWGEYKLIKIWDAQAASEVYALYCYEITNYLTYIGALGGWVKKGQGNKAWATRTANHFGDRLTQGNDLVAPSPKAKNKSLKSAKSGEV